jgi:hypothetical protein
MEDQAEFDLPQPDSSRPGLPALDKVLREAIDLESLVVQQESELKATKAALQRIKTGTIPDMMAELQMEKMTFMGWEVSVSDFVSGSLPKEPEKRSAAVNLLVGYGAEGLIKTEVKATFGRSQHNAAIDLAQRLVEEGFSAEIESGVHTQTLCKFARDRIEAGEQIDLDILGLYTGKVAKIKEVKK